MLLTDLLGMENFGNCPLSKSSYIFAPWLLSISRIFFNPDFTAVVQRPASAYSGFPFIIEMGIAYGGEIKSGGPHVYRFANRIPLLYDEGSDVVLKVVNDADWGRYKVKGDPPFVIVSHICSTRIPYKTAGKENVADRPEIERELKLALQLLSRKLAAYMSKRGQAEMAKKRSNLYAKYIPMIAQFCTELAGKKKEPDYQKILEEANPIEPKKTVEEENPIEPKKTVEEENPIEPKKTVEEEKPIENQ